MNEECAYVGDMWWYAWEEDTAVCPECTWEIPYTEMAMSQEERDETWEDRGKQDAVVQPSDNGS